MFALYIFPYPSVRNAFSIICIFFFFIEIFYKKSTQSVHQIVLFQSQKCKSSLVWEGGHPPPRPSPRSGASRPRLLFSSIVDNLAPLEKILRTALYTMMHAYYACIIIILFMILEIG